MDILNTFFTAERIIQIGAVVFSFLFIVITLQMYVQVKSISRTVETHRNQTISLISAILIGISVLLFVCALILL